jgi:hypothetical protein
MWLIFQLAGSSSRIHNSIGWVDSLRSEVSNLLCGGLYQLCEIVMRGVQAEWGRVYSTMSVPCIFFCHAGHHRVNRVLALSAF